MANRYFFSRYCADTPHFSATLEDLRIPYEPTDIHTGMRELKDFIELRDTHAAFARLRGTRTLGVPALLTEDGKVFFSPEALIARFS